MSIERTIYVDNGRTTVRIPENWWYDHSTDKPIEISLDGVKHELGRLNDWDEYRNSWRQYDEGRFTPEPASGYIGRGGASVILCTLAVSPEVITRPDTIAAAICRSNVFEVSDMRLFFHQLFSMEYTSNEEAMTILLGMSLNTAVGACPDYSINPTWSQDYALAVATQVRPEWLPVIADKMTKMEAGEYQGVSS